MERKVVSHKKLKEALVLGMISQEHVYVEGPPGAAKTLISETISKSTDLEFFFYQLHRDTRLDEIIGDASIVREKNLMVERLSNRLLYRVVFSQRKYVYWTISRDVLVRLWTFCSECWTNASSMDPFPTYRDRNWKSESGKLLCGTVDPESDRFTYQVEKGFVSTGEWAEAMEVLNMYLPLSFENATLNHVRFEICSAMHIRF